MKLTGKCKEEFFKWLENEYNLHSTEWEDFNTTCQNALIIEFFDSVGHIKEETIVQILINELISNRSVLEATNAAIEKANIIYNEN